MRNEHTALAQQDGAFGIADWVDGWMLSLLKGQRWLGVANQPQVAKLIQSCEGEESHYSSSLWGPGYRWPEKEALELRNSGEHRRGALQGWVWTHQVCRPEGWACPPEESSLPIKTCRRTGGQEGAAMEGTTGMRASVHGAAVASTRAGQDGQRKALIARL